MKILLANPRGFCAGVERAIEIVERVLKMHGSPIYVRHEVVHNKFVVNNLKSKGVIFVEDISDIPRGAVVIFSAHGVSKSVREKANAIGAVVYDATCPLVTKVHKEVAYMQKKNHQVVLIGHKNHPEVEGTLGQSAYGKSVHLVETIDDVNNLTFINNNDISYITQTTLSVDDTQQIINALVTKFININRPKKNDICYATQNRQNAVKKLMKHSQVLLVLGSSNSSNSNRLREIAIKMGKPAYLIDSAYKINDAWLEGVETIGVTAGASAPEVLVQEVISYLCSKNIDKVVEVSGIDEKVYFPAPKELR